MCQDDKVEFDANDIREIISICEKIKEKVPEAYEIGRILFAKARIKKRQKNKEEE